MSDLLATPGQGIETKHAIIKVAAEQIGNQFSVMQAELGPKQLLAPHTHDDYDQAVYVISGKLVFEVGGEGGEIFEASAGSYVAKPRGIAHGFWNPTDETAVYIELSGGPEFQAFVQGSSNPITTEISARQHSVRFHRERIPGLMQKYGLSSVRGVDFKLPG